jgi:signal transduction histidine kinase
VARSRSRLDALAQPDALARRTAERDEARARFDALVEHNADAIVVVDHAGLIRFANPAAGEMLGRAPDELVGSHFGHPIVAGGTTEIELLAPGPRPVVADMRVVDAQWEGSPCHIATLRDITDRKRAAQRARRLIRARSERAAARAALRRFRFLADAGTTLSSSLDYPATLAAVARLCVADLADWAVIYVVEEDGRVRRLEVAHRDPGQAETVEALRQQPIEPGDTHPVFEVLRTGRPLVVHEVDDAGLGAITRDERHRQLVEALRLKNYMLVPMSARGRRLGAIALVRTDAERTFTEADVALATALAARAALAVDNARLYHEAQLADQAKTDLLAVIAHDLRTPLNAIIGYAELLASELADTLGDKEAEWVRRIRRSAEHQVHLIDQLLAFSRLEVESMEVRPRELDLGRFMEDLLEMVEPLAHQCGLALRLDVPGGVRVRTDPEPLRQIVVNLLTNAVKYTEKGEVRLEAEVRDADAIVRVRDTGIGIPSEHLDHVFEPFWRVDPERHGADGAGLGLSIVQRLVRLLGGEITVVSEVGQGSEFRVRLPGVAV